MKTTLFALSMNRAAHRAILTAGASAAALALAPQVSAQQAGLDTIIVNAQKTRRKSTGSAHLR